MIFITAVCLQKNRSVFTTSKSTERAKKEANSIIDINHDGVHHRSNGC
jgi:hypothetical protein